MSLDDMMADNASELEGKIVGHRIVRVEKNAKIPDGVTWSTTGTALILDSGRKVFLVDTEDCCAYTELDSFLAGPDMVDHIITAVRTYDDYTTWHILADMEEVLKLDVSWSEGSGYYSYGFDIIVIDEEDSK